MTSMWDPEEDGVNHVNVYSKGRTELGRLLSNFAHTPFSLPRDGQFASVEAYWYWLSAPFRHPRESELRRAHGWRAKQIGRDLRAEDWPNFEGFEERIRSALDAKYAATPRISELFGSTEPLPLAHYYVYHGKVVEPAEGKWMLAFWVDKWAEARR